MKDFVVSSSGKKARTLAEFLGVDSDSFKLMDPSSFALLIIDAHKVSYPLKFGGILEEDHPYNVVRRIESILPAFRELGATVIMVYSYDRDENFKRAHGGYHLIPQKGDIVISKKTASLFKDNKIDVDRLLRKRRIKGLFVCGYYAGLCVHATVTDAIGYGHRTSLMENLIGEEGISLSAKFLKESALDSMEEEGAYITNVSKSLDFLRVLSPAESGKVDEGNTKHISLVSSGLTL